MDAVPLESEISMITIRRFVVLLAGLSGLLVVSQTAAQAFVSANHSEPLRPQK
jgi:hypothetical protein